MGYNVAFVCPPLQGHINPMSAIAHGLKNRGLNVKFIGLLDAMNYIRDFDLIIIGNKEFPKSSIFKITQKMSKHNGMRMGRIWQSRFANKWSDVVCKELPQIIEDEKIDFIICDQLEPAVALVADHLKIPFITICNAMAIVMDLTLPPFFVSWDYDISERRLTINNGFYMIADLILKHDTRILEKWRKLWNMPERHGMRRYFAHSDLAILSQQTESLEFPLTQVNKDWFYCGPFRNHYGFSYERIFLPKDDVNNVYISLGSIQGSRYKLLKKTAKICNELGLKAIIAHAGLLKESNIKKLKKHALVYDYVKQPDIFEECKFLISHCGLNTALDALSYGRPIVAMPIGIEQGAIATKLKRVGCAAVVKRKRKRNIKKAILSVISDPEYTNNSIRIMREIKNSGGTEKAINEIIKLIERDEILIQI